MKVTKAEYDNLRSNLAEGFHAAFRKACNDPRANTIWTSISLMPDKEWNSVIDFVMSGTFQIKKPTKAKVKK